MALFPLKHFRCDVVWRSTDRSLAFALEFQFSCQSEISYFYLHFLIEEQIPEFKVAMDDAVVVKIFQRVKDLNGVALDFELMKALPSAK